MVKVRRLFAKTNLKIPVCSTVEGRFGGPLFLQIIDLLLPHFIRLGRHQAVELSIFGERICERYDIACAANQPAACGNIGDVAKLVIRDVQQLRQFRAVGGALVQHHEKLRVGQHQAGGVGAQQFVHILRQPGHKSVVLADALPQLVEKIRAVLIAEQNVKLITENPRSAPLFPVLNHAVVNRIQRHQHTQRHIHTARPAHGLQVLLQSGAQVPV